MFKKREKRRRKKDKAGGKGEKSRLTRNTSTFFSLFLIVLRNRSAHIFFFRCANVIGKEREENRNAIFFFNLHNGVFFFCGEDEKEYQM